MSLKWRMFLKQSFSVVCSACCWQPAAWEFPKLGVMCSLEVSNGFLSETLWETFYFLSFFFPFHVQFWLLHPIAFTFSYNYVFSKEIILWFISGLLTDNFSLNSFCAVRNCEYSCCSGWICSVSSCVEGSPSPSLSLPFWALFSFHCVLSLLGSSVNSESPHRN